MLISSNDVKIFPFVTSFLIKENQKRPFINTNLEKTPIKHKYRTLTWSTDTEVLRGAISIAFSYMNAPDYEDSKRLR